MHLVFTFAFVECKATMQSSCNLIQGKTKAFQGPPIPIFARDKPEGNSHFNSVALDSKGNCIPSGTPPICRTIFNYDFFRCLLFPCTEHAMPIITKEGRN